MKKVFKFCILASPFFCFLTTNAQFSTTVAPNIRVTNPAAKVGIGDYPNPNAQVDLLTIGGNLSLYPTSDGQARQINARTNTSFLNINSNTNSSDGTSITMYGANHPTAPGMMSFTANGAFATPFSAYRFELYTPATTTWKSLMVLYKSGDMDISGTNFSFLPTTDNTARRINASTNTTFLNINSNSNSSNGTSITMYGANHPTAAGMMSFTASGAVMNLESAYRFDLFLPSSSTYKTLMAVYKTGNMEVCGKIRAKEITVETGWCDYVFNDNYKLRSLNELEQYIKAYKHLPEIPTTEEITTNGAPIGEITSKLLLKVEELTLYMLQLKKQNEALQAEVNILKSKI